MKIKLTELETAAATKPEGYYDDVMSKGTVDGEYLIISIENYTALVKKYSPNKIIDVPESTCCNKKLPGVKQQMANVAKSLGQTVKAIVKQQPVLASEDTINNRKNICETCEFWIAANKRCSICGCFTNAKIKLANEKCPKNFW